MLHLGLRGKILLGFIAIILVAVGVAALEFWSLSIVQNDIAELEVAQNRQRVLFDIKERTQELDRHLEQYLTVSGEEYRQIVLDDANYIRDAFISLQGEFSQDEQRELFAVIITNVEKLNEEASRLLSIDFTEASAGSVNAQVLVTYQNLQRAQADITSLTAQLEAQFSGQIVAVRERITGVTQQLILLIVLVFALALVISFVISRALTRSVTDLMRAATSLSGGKYDVRANVFSNDEIGQLARTFNSMAGRLSQHAKGLEEQVQERTKELAEKVEVIHKQLEEMQRINRELDRSGKLLIRRDLELSRANEKLLSLDKMKSEFISVAAHQLRTPLTAIKWSLRILSDGDFGTLTPAQLNILMKGYESNERIIQLVNDLLSVDRIEAGKFSYDFSEVCVTDIVDDVLKDLSPRAVTKGVHIILKRRTEVCPDVRADAQKLHAVLQNLVENAIKYTPADGTVHIDTVKEGNMVHVSVADTGIGIPQGEQERIFSKFFRGSNAMKMMPDGTGLGLFIAHEIVDKHGGQIWFESDGEHGTTFHFTIPQFSEHN